MLCYVMLCTLCYVILYYVMLCCATLCHFNIENIYDVAVLE